MDNWITTFSGKHFDLANPTPAMVNIADIAHALPNIGRFTGHSSRRYSVAEHCVIGSFIIAPELALDFLLHDATEAYYGDVVTPLKRGLGSSYGDMYGRAEALIDGIFSVDSNHAEVKRVDALMLGCEFDVLFDRFGKWRAVGDGEAERIRRWIVNEKYSYQDAFLMRFAELTAELLAGVR